MLAAYLSFIDHNPQGRWRIQHLNLKTSIPSTVKLNTYTSGIYYQPCYHKPGGLKDSGSRVSRYLESSPQVFIEAVEAFAALLFVQRPINHLIFHYFQYSSFVKPSGAQTLHSTMFPPEVNQTHRTAQKWQLLVPRLRQVQRLERHSQRRTNTPVLNLFMKGISLDIWDKLARPNLAIPTSATRQVGILAASRTIPCRLESMPGELLAMILRDCSLTREEVIAVGLASRILSQHALRHIEQDCRTSFAPWAGMEIAYTGTWLTDLPESFARNDMAKSSVPARGRGRMYEARKINGRV